jgi:hypothetical protein
MKRKMLKLFLLLCTIILSLVSFTSCRETPPEDPDEELNDNGQSAVNKDLEEIKDEELLNFIFTSKDLRVPRPNKYVVPISLVDFYNYSQQEHIDFFELSAAEEYNVIAAYIPSYLREAIFETDPDTYFQNECNELGFAKIMQFLESNEISWSQVGLKAYFVKNGEVPLKNDDEELIFVGTQLSIFNNASLYKRHVRPISFKVSENEKLEISFENEAFLGKRFISVEAEYLASEIANEETLSARVIYIENDGERQVVKTSFSAINNLYNGEKFEELCRSALLNTEPVEVPWGNGEDIIYVYDYLKIKEIFEIK